MNHLQLSALAMGGYGDYVWSCYGIVSLFLLVTALRLVRKKKQVYRALGLFRKK